MAIPLNTLFILSIELPIRSMAKRPHLYNVKQFENRRANTGNLPRRHTTATPRTRVDSALRCRPQTEMLLTFTTLPDVCSNWPLSEGREYVPKLFVNVAKRVSATSGIHICPEMVVLAHLVGHLRPRISLFRNGRGDAVCCAPVLLPRRHCRIMR